MTNPPLGARVRDLFRTNGEVLGAFFCSRLLIWALAWLANHLLRAGEQGHLPEGNAPWTMLFRWDSHWYTAIAQSGYSYVAGEQSRVAFFPAFPLCLRAFTAITGADAPLAGFLLSNAFLLGAALLLHRLVALDFPPPSRVPARTIWLLMLYPATFFFSAAYSESLFLLLSLVAILAARQRLWPLAGLAGAILTATRANGIIIVVPLFWEAVGERWRAGAIEWRSVLRSCAWLLLAPLGLVAYCVYLHFTFGDALAFAHATAAWGRTLTTPWRAAINAWWFNYPGAYAGLFLATEIAAIIALVLGFRFRLRMGYQLYAAAMLLFLFSNTLLESLPRYVSVIFPLPLALAAATARSEGLFLMVLAASAALMALCLALYTGGYWFT